MDALEDLLHPDRVLLIGRADEEVVGGVQDRGQRLEFLGVPVGELAWLEPLRGGCVGDRLAVLVGPGQEEHVLAALAHVTRDHVGGDRRVRVSEVRLRVHVIDRGGDVEGHRKR